MFYRFITSAIALVLSGMLTAAQAQNGDAATARFIRRSLSASTSKEKGLYKAAGLNVDIQPADFPAIQMVSRTSSSASPPPIDPDRAQQRSCGGAGSHLPPKPFVLFSLAKSGIKTPADFPNGTSA
jgi:hypothetical protein